MEWLKKLGYLSGMAVAVVYILNPGAGVLELIPDNAPIVGNLDEVAAVGLFIQCWRMWRGEKKPKQLPEATPTQTTNQSESA